MSVTRGTTGEMKSWFKEGEELVLQKEKELVQLHTAVLQEERVGSTTVHTEVLQEGKHGKREGKLRHRWSKR